MDSVTSSSSAPLLWRHCFLDASNVNLVEASLRVESLVSTEAQHFHRIIHTLGGREIKIEHDDETATNSTQLDPNATIEDHDGQENYTDHALSCASDFGFRMLQFMPSWRRSMSEIRSCGRHGISSDEMFEVLRQGAAGLTRFGHWQQLQSWSHLVEKHTVATPTAMLSRVGPDFAVLRWFDNVGKLSEHNDEQGGDSDRQHKHAVLGGYHIVWELVDDTHMDAVDSAILRDRDNGDDEDETNNEKTTSTSRRGVIRMAFEEDKHVRHDPIRRRRLVSTHDEVTGMRARHCDDRGICFASSSAATFSAEKDVVEELDAEEEGDMTIMIEGFRPGHTYQMWILPFVKNSLHEADVSYVSRTKLEPMLAVGFTTFSSRTASRPSPPLAMDVQPNAVKLSWTTLPSHLRGGLPIDEYVVERRMVTEDVLSDNKDEITDMERWTDAVHFSSSSTFGWIKGLTPGKRYVFRVAVINRRGVGEFSAPSLITSTQKMSKAKVRASTTTTRSRVEIKTIDDDTDASESDDPTISPDAEIIPRARQSPFELQVSNRVFLTVTASLFLTQIVLRTRARSSRHMSSRLRYYQDPHTCQTTARLYP